MYKPNISKTERWASTVMGAALAAAGYQQRNKLLRIAGFALLGRGASGFCPVSAVVGRDTAARDTRVRLGGPRGVNVEAAVTIYRPQEEVYAYWRNPENLAKFMDHLVDVRDLDGRRSHWVAKGPLGVQVEWDAEIIKDVPPELISWKTVNDADVASAGSVWFKQGPGDHGTEVRVRLQYDPPAGKLGATVAWMLGDDPQTAIEEDLQRFKQLLETGEVSREASKGSRSRTKSPKRARRDTETSPIITEPYTAP